MPPSPRASAALLPLLVCLSAGPADAQHDRPAEGMRRGVDLDGWTGAYRTASGGTMSLSRFAHGKDVVYLFTDFGGGWRGVLRRLADGTFALVPHPGPAGTAEPRLALATDADGARGVALRLRDLPTCRARRLGVTPVPVEFDGDGVRLAGEVVLPPGPGPHPGVVFVHGSGPATRDDYREWSHFFAANGIAALVYDKRGAGASGGDHRTAGFDDLARDALAAVRTLRAHPAVDSARVGLSGGSQGAWVGPIAAGLDGDLAFLVLTGGGPIAPAEQEIYRRARLVEDAGHPAAAVQAARSVVTAYFDYLGGGGRDAGLAARVSDAWARYGREPWFTLFDLPATDPTVGEWPEGRRRFAAELHFDPAPSVRALTTPTLAVLGSEDQGFPVDRVVRAYRKLVPSDRLTVRIVDGADHGFWIDTDPVRGWHQAPELFELMLAWIRDRVGPDGP